MVEAPEQETAEENVEVVDGNGSYQLVSDLIRRSGLNGPTRVKIEGQTCEIFGTAKTSYIGLIPASSITRGGKTAGEVKQKLAQAIREGES